MRVGLVVQDGCFGSGTSSIVDILGVAEMIRPSLDAAIPPLEVFVAGSRRRVTTSSGMTIATSRTLRELDDMDVVVLPALGTFTGPHTEEVLASRDGRAMVKAMQDLDPAEMRFAAACTGVFALAETGLLDGHRATTTWFLTPAFKARYPSVDVDLDAMVVSDGLILTAGAAFAHIDMAIALVRNVSAELAQEVARLLLIDDRPSQAAFFSYDHFEHDDPIVLAFERHVRQHLDAPFDSAAVATAIGSSRRTLERRTRAVVGLSPLEIVQRLRLERADHLRRSTALSTEEIARRVGYANAETLRALQRRSARAAS